MLGHQATTPNNSLEDPIDMHRVKREMRDGMPEVFCYEGLGISPHIYSICGYSEGAEEKDTKWSDKNKLWIK
jgi:hypothetical protein